MTDHHTQALRRAAAAGDAEAEEALALSLSREGEPSNAIECPVCDRVGLPWACKHGGYACGCCPEHRCKA